MRVCYKSNIFVCRQKLSRKNASVLILLTPVTKLQAERQSDTSLTISYVCKNRHVIYFYFYVYEAFPLKSDTSFL